MGRRESNRYRQAYILCIFSRQTLDVDEIWAALPWDCGNNREEKDGISSPVDWPKMCSTQDVVAGYGRVLFWG